MQQCNFSPHLAFISLKIDTSEGTPTSLILFGFITEWCDLNIDGLIGFYWKKNWKSTREIKLEKRFEKTSNFINFFVSWSRFIEGLILPKLKTLWKNLSRPFFLCLALIAMKNCRAINYIKIPPWTFIRLSWVTLLTLKKKTSKGKKKFEMGSGDVKWLEQICQWQQKLCSAQRLNVKSDFP